MAGFVESLFLGGTADIERRAFGGGLMVADFRRWAFVGRF